MIPRAREWHDPHEVKNDKMFHCDRRTSAYEDPDAFYRGSAELITRMNSSSGAHRAMKTLTLADVLPV